MKKLLFLLSSLLVGMHCFAGGILSGPWVADVREDRLTVVWTTAEPSTAFVELKDGTTLWETFAGRRVFGRLHKVRITGLTPGEVLHYRVGGIPVVDDTNPRDPTFGDPFAGPWHSTRTFDSAKGTCRFSVFNDIHMRTEQFAALAGQVDSSATDFLFLNGDIVTAANYTLDSLVHNAIDPLGSLPAGIPLLFARGNHEGRGNNVQLVADVFPNEDPAPFYYSFREGPVACLVLDGGETHTKRSTVYSGAKVYETYLQEQYEWAEKALQEPAFREAPVKVCLIHVPMIDPEGKQGFYIQRWLHKRFLPLLNEAGIDLMISADLHEFLFYEPGTMNNAFPILVNDDLRRLDFTYGDGTALIRTFNAKGEQEFEYRFQP